MDSMRQIGIHHLAEIDKMRIDHALISTLIKRGRPVTNTFHFVHVTYRRCLVYYLLWILFFFKKLGCFLTRGAKALSSN